jgi:hypothetical protein
MALQTKLTNLTPVRERLKLKTKLVSGGYSVRDRLPDGSVTVMPWETSVSEWLANRDVSSEGETQTLLELAKQVTGLKDDVLSALPEGEIPMILMVSRALAFNEQKLQFSSKCPHCGHIHTGLSVKVPDDLTVVAQKPADYAGHEPAITLPVCKDSVIFRPLLVSDAVAVERQIREPDPLRGKIPESILRLASSIVSVGEGTPDSPREAVTYLRALHPADVEAFQVALAEASPALSPAINLKCDNEDCAKDFKHVLSLRRDFFRSIGRV